MRPRMTPTCAEATKHLPRLFVAAALMISVSLLLTGCQAALDVGARNECGHPVEADANSIDTDEDINWDRLEPGARVYLASVEEGAKVLYIHVRVRDDAQVVKFEVPVASLPEPPDGYGYEVEVVLEGDRCPPDSRLSSG